MSDTFVTIVIPALNERDYIIGTLDELISGASAYPFEVIVADGGSADGTQVLVEAYAKSHPSVRLVHNPERIQSAAVNLAARLAASEATVLVRADAHCSYPPGFVNTVVEALTANKAQSVVVPMFTVGEAGTYQEAVALAQNSKLGNGGSAHRAAGALSGWVDHGHHAAFDIGFFRSLGGYDESFATNEDAEYDARVVAAGGRVWMHREAEINYYPRRTPLMLAKQYFAYGRGRVATVLKHKIRPKPRQMAPLVILGTTMASLLFAPACGFSLLPLAGYLALCLAYSVRISAGRGGLGSRALQVLSAFVIMHHAWATGFAAGWLRNVLSRFRKDD
jgi:succinoglycan biosynthesis protein ExoA